MLHEQEWEIQPKQVYNLNRKQTGIKQNLGEVKDSHLQAIFMRGICSPTCSYNYSND